MNCIYTGYKWVRFADWSTRRQLPGPLQSFKRQIIEHFGAISKYNMQD